MHEQLPSFHHMKESCLGICWDLRGPNSRQFLFFSLSCVHVTHYDFFSRFVKTIYFFLYQSISPPNENARWPKGRRSLRVITLHLFPDALKLKIDLTARREKECMRHTQSVQKAWTTTTAHFVFVCIYDRQLGKTSSRKKKYQKNRILIVSPPPLHVFLFTFVL